MKRNTLTRILSLLLLLVYLISSNSFLQFHEHQDTHISYAKANACEKHIYFPHADKEELCTHKAQISQSFVKCSLCDHHATTHYVVNASFSIFSLTGCPDYTKIFVQRFIASDQSSIDSRGPPSVFFFLG